MRHPDFNAMTSPAFRENPWPVLTEGGALSMTRMESRTGPASFGGKADFDNITRRMARFHIG